MNRIESIRDSGKEIEKIVMDSLRIMKKLPQPLGQHLLTQTEKANKSVRDSVNQIDKLSRMTLTGDTIRHGSQLAKETKKMLETVAKRNTVLKDSVKAFSNQVRKSRSAHLYSLNQINSDIGKIVKETEKQALNMGKDA